MLWFLGYVSEQDLKKNVYIPSFILRKTPNNTYNSGWTFTIEDKERPNPKILFNNINDHNSIAAINFTSSYSFRRTKNSKREILKGALFWFPCDENGDQIQPPLFIIRVPLKTDYSHLNERTRVAMAKKRFEKRNVAQLLSSSVDHIPIDTTGVKPYFWSFECPSKEKYKELYPVDDDIRNKLYRT